MVSTIAFREIVEAYETLTDAQSRKQYDLTGDTDSKSNQVIQIVAMNGIGTLISTSISDSRINVMLLIDIYLTHYDDIKSSMRSLVLLI